MNQNFSDANLQGKSFQNKDLSSANFSGADLRGTDFRNAILIGANFSNVKAGLQHHWIIGFIIISLMLGLSTGYISGYVGGFAGSVLIHEGYFSIPFWSTIVAIFILVTFALTTIRQGFGGSLGILAFITALAAIIVAAASRGEKVIANAVIFLVTQCLVIGGAVAGVMIGALAIALIRLILKNRVFITFFIIIWIISFIGAVPGTLEGLGKIPSQFLAVAWTIAGLVTILVITVANTVGFRSTGGDKKYNLIRRIAMIIATFRGTKFIKSNLTNADFTEAKLQNTDFRKAILKRTCWFQAKNLDLARVENTYLEKPSLLQLVISKNGEGEFYDYQDLRGLNFKNANLVDASFIGADLSEATLQYADLSRAKLVQTRLYGSDLTHAILTGVCIQDWAISTDTQLQQVRCEYVYMRLPTKEDPDPWRKPDNRQETFREGDFSDFIAPIIKTMDLYRQQNVDPRRMASTFKTLDLYHYQGIDPSAAAIALKQLAEQYPDAGLEVVSLEGRGDEKVKLQAVVSDAVNQSQLSVEYFQRYREISALPYKDIQALLAGIAEKDDRIRSLEQMVNSAIQSNKYYVETYYQMGDTVSEKSSIDIKAGGDIGNISGIIAGDVSGVVNLGSISGNVTNTINQLPESTDPNQASLKELLTQLQAAIESETELPDEDKAEALEQVKTLAEAGQKPEDTAMQKASKTAMKILKGTTAGLSETNKLFMECAKLLPAIAALLALV